MKKERVVRTTQFLYAKMYQTEKQSFCFTICDKVVMLSVYDSTHVTVNEKIKPQPIKIHNCKKGNRFNYYAWLTSKREGLTMRGKGLFCKQFKIRKGTKVTDAYLEKILAQEVLNGGWDNE